MSQLSSTYDPKAHEEAIYKRWEESEAFKPFKGVPKESKPFVVMMPPPNVTGSLHMGHALEDTLSDVLVRFHRMKGEATLWVPGTDHAALPTNALIEKQLRAEGLTKQAIGREKFMARVQAWYEKYGDTIVDQMKRLGASCDWSHFMFTLDPPYVAAVLEAFIRHYNKGHIYRGTRLVNWCPHCASVISDLELEYLEEKATLYTLRYGPIDVATVRPETMLGDTAVAVHPADERYAHLIGTTVMLPLMNREIPVIADEGIDRDFGTGAVKVTPAHDRFDNELGHKHQLPELQVIGEDGRLTAAAGTFAGLTTAEARQQIVEALHVVHALVAEEPYRHSVARCERCHTTIEPLLSKQWFVSMKQLKEHTRQAVAGGEVQFHGPRWKQHLLDWIEGEHDWTISRQIWLGQQIPVWWKKGTRGTQAEEGNYVVSLAKPDGDWEQDPDVLDTWFSSALWPLATLGWPKKDSDLDRFYPTSFLTTAREILYLWEHRMIFTGLEFMGQVPFKDVLIHPTVLTKSGKRMSKSLGTGIDPLELIDRYGADATRFGLMYQMSYDRQAIKFDEEVIKNARNFANKIWNLGRLLQNLSPSREGELEGVADVWIQERLAETTRHVSQLLEEYKIGEASQILYDFVWHDYADWYVEIFKIEGSSKNAQEVFVTILKLLHPFMPFVTEVLWSSFAKASAGEDQKMLIVSTWPQAPHPNPLLSKGEGEAIDQFKDIVTTIRSARILLGIAPKEIVDVFVPGEIVLPKALATMARATLVDSAHDTMKRFALASGEAVALGSSSITADSLAAAQARLAKEVEQLTDFIARQSKILEHMRDKAEPEAVTEKEILVKQSQKRLAELRRSQEALKLR